MGICSRLGLSCRGAAMLIITSQTSLSIARWQVDMKRLNTRVTLYNIHVVQWYILLRWPEGHVFSGEPLKLCFEDEEEAECWRDALVTAVSGDSMQARTTQQSSVCCLEMLIVAKPWSQQSHHGRPAQEHCGSSQCRRQHGCCCASPAHLGGNPITINEATAWICAALSAGESVALKAAAHKPGSLGRLRRHFTPDRSKQVHWAVSVVVVCDRCQYWQCVECFARSGCRAMHPMLCCRCCSTSGPAGWRRPPTSRSMHRRSRQTRQTVSVSSFLHPKLLSAPVWCSVYLSWQGMSLGSQA